MIQVQLKNQTGRIDAPYVNLLTIETFALPALVVDGTTVALLTPEGDTLAIGHASGGQVILDSNTLQAAGYCHGAAVGESKNAFLVIGETDALQAIIPVLVRANPLDDLAPPAALVPIYPTTDELRSILFEMEGKARRAEDSANRAESAEASVVAKRAEDKAAEAVRAAQRAEDGLSGKQDSFGVGDGLLLENGVLSATGEVVDIETIERGATVWDGVRLSSRNYDGLSMVDEVFDWWRGTLGELLGFEFREIVRVKRVTLFKRNGSGEDVPNEGVPLYLRIWRWTSSDGWIVAYESSNSVRMEDYAGGQEMVFDMVDFAQNDLGLSADTGIILAFSDHNRAAKFVRASAKGVAISQSISYCTKSVDFSKYSWEVLGSYVDYVGTPALVLDYEAENIELKLSKKVDMPLTSVQNINITPKADRKGAVSGIAIGDIYLGSYSVNIGHGKDPSPGNYSVSIGYYVRTLSNNMSVAIGYAAASQYGAVAIGAHADAAAQSVLVGAESSVGEYAVGVGRFVSVGEGCFAAGVQATAMRGSLSVGFFADADVDSVAIGKYSYAMNRSLALGSDAQALADGCVAIGCRCQNSTANSVKILAGDVTGGASLALKMIAGESLAESFFEFVHTDVLSAEVKGRRISVSKFFDMLDQFGATEDVSDSLQGYYGYYS